MKYWMMAIRPKTLFASIGPVVLGLSIVYQEFHQIDLPLAFLTLLTALLLQASSNLINDYYDGLDGKDSSERLGPDRVTSLGLIAPKKVKLAFIIGLLLSFIFGLILMYQGGMPIIIIGAASLFFAWAYTGGPFPLSRIGLGEVTALIFFGPIPVWGTYYLQTLSHSEPALLIGLVPGFISAALMAVNNLRDRNEDSKNNKRTIATFLSENGARYFVLNLILLSTFFLPLVTAQMKNTIVIIPTIIFFKTWKRILLDPISKEFNELLANTGKYLFIQCLFHAVAINI
tara:strand:- start:24193 stop:25053 length:861 start_codon:yes stop_codon:yes gene_type:complete